MIVATSTTENICNPSSGSLTVDIGDLIVIHSPGYPNNNYGNNLDCSRTMTTSTGHDMQVTVFCSHISMLHPITSSTNNYPEAFQ